MKDIYIDMKKIIIKMVGCILKDLEYGLEIGGPYFDFENLYSSVDKHGDILIISKNKGYK